MYWSGNKQPTTAILFSFVGGIIVLANGLDRVYIPKYALFPPAVLASVGLLSGALVLLSTLLLWAAPRQHRWWGVVIIASSVASLLIGGGMFLVTVPLGFMLGLIGGILAIIWVPASVTAPTPAG